MEKEVKKVTVSLSSELIALIDKYADEHHVSRSAAISFLISEILKK